MTVPGLPPDLIADLVRLADAIPADAEWDEAHAAMPIEDAAFDELARRVFSHQFAANPTYRRFCEGRGVSPGEWPGWEHVPAVPTRGFKDLDLISGPSDAVERTFRTSGTSAGRGRRGTHHVLSVDLYRRLSLPWFRANLLPDFEPGDRIRILSLVPRAGALPDSSLSAMVEFVLEACGAEGSRSVVDPASGIDGAAVTDWLRAAEVDREPVLVLGTAFAFVHLIDHLVDRELRLFLPPGSRAMETGGFKGRSREVPRDELYRGIADRTGIPTDRIVNEYGMTELLSQFYEPILRAPGTSRRHVPPPWMRTRILDPDTLDPVAPGESGLLQHFDLGNLGSVSAVLTDDLGRASGDGFVVLGRVPGSEPRGCSLAMDELLEGSDR
ncbi:MAG TPA: hypothetical protein VJ925_04860 [Longimicrobiales bacterium]|nr:hypothetical protein [Longimicrobiales bacterium]